jgi:hypothetical protein
VKGSLIAVAFAATFLAGSAQAAGVALLTPVVIDPAAHLPDKAREECRVDYQLEANILESMRHYDPQVQTTTDASSGRVLKVAISYVLGTGGGSWTGPKVIAVRVDLLNDGKVEYSTKMHRRSSLFGPMSGTCHLLDGASKGLGKLVAKWVQHPKTSAVDEEGEAEVAGQAASEPASGPAN